MSKAKFDLGDSLAGILGSVSPSDTQEQITYIDITSLDASTENFYSMEGLDELAANIELVGLQQPLRVRENPDMRGRYFIVSGHRRRAALWTLYEEAPEKWGRVPCIIERGGGSPELQELRLIMANADTRRMSSADLAKQAERVEMLLYHLKEQGYEFPGRMRDHVAEACKVSATKLAVLTAIRNNLIPELYAYYEKNEINESAAYELQKLPVEGQKEIAKSCNRTGARFISGVAVEHCVKYAEQYMSRDACEDGSPCTHREARFVQALRTEYGWMRCTGECCLKCHELRNCDRACAKGKAKKQAKKEADKEEKEKQKAKDELAREKLQKKNRASRQKQALRLLPLIEAAGLTDDDFLGGEHYWNGTQVAEVRKVAAGELDGKYYYDGNIIPSSLEMLTSWADKLGCTLDFLAGRTDEPAPAAIPQRTLQFRSGAPDHDAVCWCIFDLGDDNVRCDPALWKGGKWRFYGIDADIIAECIGWIELPDYEGKLRK